MTALVRLAMISALTALPAAPADAAVHTARSSNWSGYAAHAGGLRFRSVSAQWTQPTASCTPGQRTYSAMWVGLGGYRKSSNALEQVGTELDCSASGRPSSSAWYELVPRGSRTIDLTIQPGDHINASVSVSGHVVLVQLRDRTSGQSFSRQLRASKLDTRSAEWIVEAPSECANSCHTLPLADFGSATFSGAGAQTTAGHAGAISDRRWRATRIVLIPHARQFVSLGGTLVAGEAIPAPLSSGGGAFTVTYRAVTR